MLIHRPLHSGYESNGTRHRSFLESVFNVRFSEFSLPTGGINNSSASHFPIYLTNGFSVMGYMVRLVNSTGVNPRARLSCREIGSSFGSNTVWHTVTENKAFNKSMGFGGGTRIDGREGTCVTILQITAFFLLEGDQCRWSVTKWLSGHPGERHQTGLHTGLCRWKLKSSDHIGEPIHSLCLCPHGHFVHLTVICRMCHLAHGIIESLPCGARPLLCMHMQQKYVSTLYSPNTFSPDVLLPVFQFYTF